MTTGPDPLHQIGRHAPIVGRKDHRMISGV
jgi:hypothetical protein